MLNPRIKNLPHVNHELLYYKHRHPYLSKRPLISQTPDRLQNEYSFEASPSSKELDKSPHPHYKRQPNSVPPFKKLDPLDRKTPGDDQNNSLKKADKPAIIVTSPDEKHRTLSFDPRNNPNNHYPKIYNTITRKPNSILQPLLENQKAKQINLARLPLEKLKPNDLTLRLPGRTLDSSLNNKLGGSRYNKIDTLAPPVDTENFSKLDGLSKSFLTQVDAMNTANRSQTDKNSGEPNSLPRRYAQQSQYSRNKSSPRPIAIQKGEKVKKAASKYPSAPRSGYRNPKFHLEKILNSPYHQQIKSNLLKSK